MFFFMTTNKKRQCYPLCFFSWRPIKNDSVTPCGFFHDDQLKTTVLPLKFFFMTTYKKRLIFYLTKTTVLPLMLFFMKTNKKQQCYHLWFLSWRPTTVLPPMFYLMNIDSVTPYVYFMTADKKRQLPLMFFPCWPMKDDSGTPVDVFAGIRTWAVWSINLRTYQCTIKTQNRVNTMVILDFIIRMK